MSRRICPEWFIAAAQTLLTGTLFMALFLLIYVVFFQREVMPDQMVRLADTLVGGIISLSTMACSYWFQRQRAPDVPPTGS